MRFRPLLIPSLLLVPLVACRSTPEEEPAAAETVAAESSQVEPAAGPAEVADAEEGQASAIEAAAPTQGGSAEQVLSAEQSRLRVLRDRAEVLANQFLSLGDAALAEADLEEALTQYAKALDLLPSSEAARTKMRQVEALMGDSYATAGTLLDDATQREVVRRSQARLAAQQAMIDGDNARVAGDFQKAVDSYREAELIIGYHPLIADGSLDALVVRRKLESAIEEREAARLLAEETSRRDAEAARLREEEEQRNYRANKLSTLYAEAHTAFLSENYAQAEALAAQVLLLDPGNPQATEMRDIAQSARHQKTDEVLRRTYREQWLRTFDDLDTLAVPQTDPLVYDDLVRWTKVQERKPHGFTQAAGGTDAERDEILRRLSEVRIPVSFGLDGEGAPLTEVARFLQQVTNINFVIAASVADLDEEETAVSLNLPERSVLNVLELIASTSESLRWRIQDGVVKFVSAADLVGGQALQMYSVTDLISRVPDFPGLEVNVLPSGGIEYAEEELSEKEALVITTDELEGLIRENVSPESWDADPANTLRITDSGTLVVTQTPEVHAEIAALLADLREATGIMVDINARFLSVADNFLEDIGVDFRGLGAPGLGSNAFFNDFGDPSVIGDLQGGIGQDADVGVFYDRFDGSVASRIENLYDTTLGEEGGLSNAGGLSFQWAYLNDLQLEMVLRAVSKKERVELVTAPRVLVANTARANLSVLNQVAYIQDYDVQIAQGAAIADPIIQVIQDGVVLDVRPVVSADRRFITLELRPTVAELDRPLRELTVTLANQGSVTLQLPEVEIQRARTTVPLPDGGTVMLGGLKVHNEQRQEAGVPILNKIPIINFFFERKGTYISNRKLLILIEAKIVIPSEQEPTQAQMDAYRGSSN
ncbi:MAG: hypothetical protein GC161_17060 [Planctomycetaceae bacterium]|nr:hypothetical protein [Planctomycetaceae bacterium]